ncbi:phage minor capsid protein [Nonomuraea sp. NPDC050328]|uniref:phage minor capsid protein n=1 Tax=Nonomuraea sp. NPDC050328 TaxID=3364361 RepID=UPI0037BB3F6C
MATTTSGPTPEQAIEQALERAKLVARMYAEAEQLLAEKIAKRATGGDDEQDAGRWQEGRFAEIGQLRKEAQQIIKRLESVAKKAAEKAVLQSWADGMDSAVVAALSQVHDDKVRKRLERVLQDARKLGSKKLINPGQGVNELARQTVEKLSAVHLSALRVVDDIYRKVIADTAGQVLTGARTRKEAARDALKRLFPVAPFRDKSGRQWRMSTYVDMAMRTATARAAVDGHLAVMRDAGIDLVIVSTTPWNCEKCDPWEGKVLTQSRAAGTISVEHALEDGVQVEVEVAATVAAARLAGLFHPQCRHSLSAYLPGVTKVPAKPTAPPPKPKPKPKPVAAQPKPKLTKPDEPKRGEEQARLNAQDAERRATEEQAQRAEETARRDVEEQGNATGVEAGDFTQLRQVGPQGGSNPGGMFEDANGNRWYVKTQQSETHAANEVASARLYRAAGIRTPDVRRGSGAPGLPDGPQTASRVVDGKQATAEELRAPAREGFGADAWLANWDTAGLTFDNMLLSPDGSVTRIDTGGSMLFRAQGSAKGDKFGNTVPEWRTLRHRKQAPQAEKLFGGLTPVEQEKALERVEQVTPAEIRRIISESGLDKDVADRLIARRADLMRRLKKVRELAQRQRAYDKKRATAATGRDALDAAPTQLTVHSYANPSKLDPRPSGWTDEQVMRSTRALGGYQGSDYEDINKRLRENDPNHSQIRDIDKVMPLSKLKKTVLSFRGIRDTKAFGSAWDDVDVAGLEWIDLSYASTSADQRIARRFAEGGDPPVIMRIVTPPGTSAIRLSDIAPPDRAPDPGTKEEAELMHQRGIKYRVVTDHGFDERGVRHLDVEVIPL